MSCSILWLRRDLRLYDNKSLYQAILGGLPIQPIFIFDTEILARFQNKNDHRLSFIAESLINLSENLKEYNGKILIFRGRATEIIPNIAKLLEAKIIYAGKDFEPYSIERDKIIGQKLGENGINLSLSVDHLILDHRNINKADGSPYRLFNPFAKAWQKEIRYDDFGDYSIYITNKFFSVPKNLENQMKNIEFFNDPKILLEKIGYNYTKNEVFSPKFAPNILKKFISQKIVEYPIARNYMAENGTSMISPYLRFGLISIRECYRNALDKKNKERWILELIWREFYSMILARFPEYQDLEFVAEFRNLKWNHNEKAFELFREGLTGYPIIDAAIRQLRKIGWMHNRMRMIVANFLCKNMFMDWRLGEEYFAQYLMDYELSSNLAGWQWAASVGANSQPYFRSFNPFLQSEKFDPGAKYIKNYVKEMRDIKDIKLIHRPHLYREKYGNIEKYPDYLIEYNFEQEKMKKFFREKKKLEIIYNI